MQMNTEKTQGASMTSLVNNNNSKTQTIPTANQLSREQKFVDELVADLIKLKETDVKNLEDAIKSKHNEWIEKVSDLSEAIQTYETNINFLDNEILRLQDDIANWDVTFRLVFAFAATMALPYNAPVALGIGSLALMDSKTSASPQRPSENVEIALKEEPAPVFTDEIFSSAERVIQNMDPSSDKTKVAFLKDYFSNQKKMLMGFNDLLNRQIHLRHVFEALDKEELIIIKADNLQSQATQRIKGLAQLINTLLPRIALAGKPPKKN